MQIYNGFSPNGMRVDVFLAEKNIELDTKSMNIPAGEAKQDAFLALNSLGEVPVLELDDGTIVTESIAICRYLEELYPDVPLFGDNPVHRAEVEMWNRRIELKIFNVIGDVGRHEFEFFKPRGQVPDYAKFRRQELADNLAWLDVELSDGRSFLVRDRFSVADITGMAALLLMMIARYEIPNKLVNVQRWADGMRARPTFPKLPDSMGV